MLKTEGGCPDGCSAICIKVVLIAIAIILVPFFAFAQAGPGIRCVPANEFEAYIAENYHEGPVWVGATNSGNFVFLTASPQGTWTVYTRTQNGLACPMAGGQKSQLIGMPPPKGDET